MKDVIKVINHRKIFKRLKQIQQIKRPYVNKHHRNISKNKVTPTVIIVEKVKSDIIELRRENK